MLILALCGGTLQAAFEDFPRTPVQRTLFEAEEGTKAAPEKDIPLPELLPEDIETGRIGLSVWVNPYLRFMTDPFAEAAGIGFEFSYLFGQTFGLTTGIAGYAGDVDVEAGHSDSSKTFGGFEAELGFRIRMARWDGGALYLDVRAAYGNFGGGDAIETTHVMGGGVHFGWEFGGTVIRGFIEGGIDLRAALNYSRAGWLNNGSRNGDVGWAFDFARVGLRVYL